MFSDYGRRRHEEACKNYVGNLCSGFGGTTICDHCGWELYQHPPYTDMFDKLQRAKGEDLEK